MLSHATFLRVISLDFHLSGVRYTGLHMILVKITEIIKVFRVLTTYLSIKGQSQFLQPQIISMSF